MNDQLKFTFHENIRSAAILVKTYGTWLLHWFHLWEIGILISFIALLRNSLHVEKAFKNELSLKIDQLLLTDLRYRTRVFITGYEKESKLDLMISCEENLAKELNAAFHKHSHHFRNSYQYINYSRDLQWLVVKFPTVISPRLSTLLKTQGKYNGIEMVEAKFAPLHNSTASNLATISG